MTRFKRLRDGGLAWLLGDAELALLVRLVGQLDEVLDGPTDDPVVERLFPQAVEGDEEADTELRALLAGDLLLSRHEACAAVQQALARAQPARRGAQRVVLREDEPELVLQVLNDVRLALGARIGTEVVAERELAEDEGTLAALASMDLLAWFQEQLLEHL